MGTLMKSLTCLSFLVCVSQLLILCKAEQDVTDKFTAFRDYQIVDFGKDLGSKPEDEFKEYGKELIKRYQSGRRVFDVLNATAQRAQTYALKNNQTITDQDPVWKALNETIRHSLENISTIDTAMTAFINEADKRATIKAYTELLQKAEKSIRGANATAKLIKDTIKSIKEDFKGSKGDKKKDSSKDSHSSKPKDPVMLTWKKRV